VGLDELTGTVNSAAALDGAATKPHGPKPYQVVTVLGDKQVVKTFY
jgi:hypothetical protein